MIVRAKHLGFTLFEVILAVALTVGLVAGMFALYSQSMKIRDRVNNDMDILLSNRLAMEHITRELRAGMQLKFLNTGMKGSTQKAEWASAQIPGHQAWAKQTIFKTPHPPEADIQIVGYRLRISTNEEGQTAIEGLERTCQKILTPILSKEEERSDETEDGKSINTIDRREAIEVAFLTPHVKLLRFRYWDGSGWQFSWGGSKLPGAVEITLGPTALPDDQTLDEFEGEYFQRVIYIPAGAQNLAEPSELESSEGSKK